jgi:hypothetical protein
MSEVLETLFMHYMLPLWLQIAELDLLLANARVGVGGNNSGIVQTMRDSIEFVPIPLRASRPRCDAES